MSAETCQRIPTVLGEINVRLSGSGPAMVQPYLPQIETIGETSLLFFGGRFSPVVIEQLPLLKATRMPFLAVWSAADAIVDNGTTPNYAFRLSLRDSLAMPFMMERAKARGLERVGLLLTNTAWGRSNLQAVGRYSACSRNTGSSANLRRHWNGGDPFGASRTFACTRGEFLLGPTRALCYQPRLSSRAYLVFDLSCRTTR